MDRPPTTPRRPLLRRLRDRLARHDTVHLDRDAGVIVHSPARFQATELPVEAVTRVHAGNLDDGAFDTVVVSFHAPGRPLLAVSEKDRGFAALIHDLREDFPGIDGWETAIPPVAFALTSVDLWRRDMPEGDSDSDPSADHVA